MVSLMCLLVFQLWTVVTGVLGLCGLSLSSSLHRSLTWLCQGPRTVREQVLMCTFLVSTCVIWYCPVDKSKSYGQVQRSCERAPPKGMDREAWLDRHGETGWAHYCKQFTRVPATSMLPILPAFWVIFPLVCK